MKDIDKELDEQIKDILNFLDEKSHQSLGYNATVQAIKQLINQARKDELDKAIKWIGANSLDDYYARIDTITAQFNSKGGINEYR